MSIDLDRAAEAFAASTDCTVGIEEEFAILDAESLDMVPRFEELRDAARGDAGSREPIAGELIASRDRDPLGPRGELRTTRSRASATRAARLFALAAARGVALGATGTHPWADYREQHNIDTEHYRARRRRPAVRGAAQQHVLAARPRRRPRHRPRGRRSATGCAGAADAAGGQRQLALPRRPRLRPALRAHAVFTKSLPALRHPRRLRLLGGLPRLPRAPDRGPTRSSSTRRSGGRCARTSRFGTVEVRICDAQTTAAGVRGARRR